MSIFEKKSTIVTCIEKLEREGRKNHKRIICKRCKLLQVGSFKEWEGLKPHRCCGCGYINMIDLKKG